MTVEQLVRDTVSIPVAKLTSRPVDDATHKTRVVIIGRLRGAEPVGTEIIMRFLRHLVTGLTLLQACLIYFSLELAVEKNSYVSCYKRGILNTLNCIFYVFLPVLSLCFGLFDNGINCRNNGVRSKFNCSVDTEDIIHL